MTLSNLLTEARAKVERMDAAEAAWQARNPEVKLHTVDVASLDAARTCIALVRSPELGEVLADKARLDWLERQVRPESRECDGSMALLLKFRFNHLWNETFREAIDQRMENDASLREQADASRTQGD